MKKAIMILLTIAMILSLCACALGEDIMDPVEFYYLRPVDSISYGDADGVIAAETREAAGHIRDLNYLLSMYLMGPSNPELTSPFPAKCHLVGINIKNDTLQIILDTTFNALEDMDLTLACACLTKTALSMTDVENIQIITSDGESKTVIGLFSRDSFLLEDEATVTELPATEENQ